MQLWLKNCLKKGFCTALQWDIDENVPREMDVISSKYCLPLLKGVWVREVDFCCSKSRQQLVSTRSSGIMTWGTVSAVLLLSTVCILWSFSLCCCMTTNPVTTELRELSVVSIKHVDQNESDVFKHQAGTKNPLQGLTLLSCFPYAYHDICWRLQVNLNEFITWTLQPWFM